MRANSITCRNIKARPRCEGTEWSRAGGRDQSKGDWSSERRDAIGSEGKCNAECNGCPTNSPKTCAHECLGVVTPKSGAQSQQALHARARDGYTVMSPTNDVEEAFQRYKKVCQRKHIKQLKRHIVEHGGDLEDTDAENIKKKDLEDKAAELMTVDAQASNAISACACVKLLG